MREIVTAYSTVTRIARAFEDEGFAAADVTLAPVPGEADSWNRDGQRRGVFDEHAASVDWSHPPHVRRALAVFEALLDEAGDDPLEGAWKVLARNGIERDETGRLRLAGLKGTADSSAGSFDVLDDPRAVQEQWDRLRRVAQADPPAAISAAKALVEAACKQVLRQLDLPVNDRMEMPALTKAAHKALALDADSIAPTKAGAETTKAILRDLAHIPVGLAELRNRYGPDHGRLTPTTGLQPRHADLAVGAASTYVTFLLATLAERTRSRG